MSSEPICFPAEDGGVLDVREVRREVCKLVGTDHPKIDDIELLTSEIATNAAIHTASGKPGGRLRLSVLKEEGRVRVEITDDGGAGSVPRLVSDPFAEHGRGLWIVRTLSDACGSWQETQGRTTVWFEIGSVARRRDEDLVGVGVHEAEDAGDEVAGAERDQLASAGRQEGAVQAGGVHDLPVPRQGVSEPQPCVAGQAYEGDRQLAQLSDHSGHVLVVGQAQQDPIGAAPAPGHLLQRGGHARTVDGGVGEEPAWGAGHDMP
jgi:anti-sigma regulatory factor (Ser/Thr protein kinase)